MPSLDRMQSRISDVGKAVPILWVYVTTFLHVLYPSFVKVVVTVACLLAPVHSPPPTHPILSERETQGLLDPWSRSSTPTAHWREEEILEVFIVSILLTLTCPVHHYLSQLGWNFDMLFFPFSKRWVNKCMATY